MPTLPEELITGLRNYWYPILISEELTAEKPVGIQRLGENLVLWRDSKGVAHTFQDRCPHRGVKLSLGDVIEDRIYCRYHGLQFDGTGQCRFVPAEQKEDGPVAKNMKARSYPTHEEAGLIFAYIGEVDIFPPAGVPTRPEFDQDKYVTFAGFTQWKANWMLVRDNTPDPAHLPFLHGRFRAEIEDGEFKLKAMPGGSNPIMHEEYVHGVLTKKLSLTETEQGGLIAEREGEPFPDVEWDVPTPAKITVPLPDGTIVVQYQYETPVNAQETAIYTLASVACPDTGEREQKNDFMANMFWPAAKMAFEEDSWMLESQGEIDLSRKQEQLMPSDIGVSRVRRLILRAYENQQKQIAAVGE